MTAIDHTLLPRDDEPLVHSQYRIIPPYVGTYQSCLIASLLSTAAAPVCRAFQRPRFDGRCSEGIHNYMYHTSLHRFNYTISELFTGTAGALRILSPPFPFPAVLWKVSSKQRRVTGRIWL